MGGRGGRDLHRLAVNDTEVILRREAQVPKIAHERTRIALQKARQIHLTYAIYGVSV